MVKDVRGQVAGSKEEDLGGKWRKSHSKEHYNFCDLQDIIHVIKLRKMEWVEHVVGVGEKNCIQDFGAEI